jgi:hypothetical protein
MTHEVRMWLVPIFAILIGSIVYFRNKDGKTAECGRCILFCGIFILLWLITFHGPWLQ